MSGFIYKETSFLKNAVNKKIHMIGIGGSSMSSLAELMIHHGFSVSGSDSTETYITRRLLSLGANVYIGHDPDNVGDPDLVVYTVAVKEDNPEYMEAVRRNIPIIDRSTLLGEILALYPKPVSVSGTHGKTTTATMIFNILSYAKKDPSLHIGGTIVNQKTSAIIGGKEFFINEACEYYNSFLHFKSFIGVILNIEADHLDFFGSFENIIEAFKNFVSIISPDGYLVVCKDNEYAFSVASSAECKVTTYSINDSSANFSTKNIIFDENGFGQYDLYYDNVLQGRVFLKVPGLHNISNSLAAIATCFDLGCNIDECINGAATFIGTSRRFEIKGTYNGITVVDDYAHHPSEVTATLEAAKNASYKNIWIAFQPHTYTRAKKLFNEFAESFTDCHKVAVADIYAAREIDPGDIHSSQLAEAINNYSNNAVYTGSIEETAKYIMENAQNGDVVISVGAGTINQICSILLEK